MSALNRSIISQADNSMAIDVHGGGVGPADTATVLMVPQDVYTRSGLLQDSFAYAGGIGILLHGHPQVDGLAAFEASALKLNAIPGVRALVAVAEGPEYTGLHGDMLVLGRPVDALMALFSGDNAIPFMRPDRVLDTVVGHFDAIGAFDPVWTERAAKFGTFDALSAERLTV